MTPREKENLIRRFETLQTGLAADAMDDLGLPCGAVPGLRLIAGGSSPAAGFAVTIKQAKRSGPFDGVPKARHAQVIDDVLGRFDMLVMETGGISDVTAGGGLLAQRAKCKGAAGFVTDGCLRDLDEIEEIRLPISCAGTSPVRSRERLETVSVNEKISLRGVAVSPGDLVLMDTTGLVVIPLVHAEAVAEQAERIRDEEDAVMAFIKEGMSIAEARARAAEDRTAGGRTAEDRAKK